MSAVIRLPGRLGAEPDLSTPLLVVDAVSHAYRLHGRDLPVLDDISLPLHHQDFATSVGPPGSFPDLDIVKDSAQFLAPRYNDILPK